MVDKVKERRGFTPLFAHKEQRYLRREKHGGGGAFERIKINKRGQPVAVHPVTDLVVVLRKDDETARRKVCRGIAVTTVAEYRVLAGIRKTFGHGLHQLCRIAEIGIVAVFFPR